MIGSRLAAALCAAALASTVAAAQEPQMRVRDRIDLTQGPDAPVRMTVETTLTGREADRLRTAIGELGLHDLAAQYEAFYAEIFGDARMVQPLVVTDVDGVLTIVEDVILPAPYQRDAAAGTYAFDFFAYAMRPIASAEDDGALAVIHPFHTRHETIVLIPGADGESSLPPESLNLVNPGFAFAFEAGPRPDNLYLLAFELRSNAASVPASAAADVLREQAQVMDLAYWGLEMDLPAPATTN